MRDRITSTARALCVSILLIAPMGQSWASCLKPPASAQSIAEFKTDPHSVTSSSDPRTIETAVRELAGTDASLAAAIVRVAEGASPRFRMAIAAGLAQAAVACTSVEQQASLLIQQAVAGFPNGEFQSAFAAVAGDLSTAATDAAAGFAANSVGSVVVTNPNRSPGTNPPPGGGGFSTPLQFTSGTATTVTTNNTSRPSTTAANPVSPTR
jgi:hypothetical protein